MSAVLVAILTCLAARIAAGANDAKPPAEPSNTLVLLSWFSGAVSTRKMLSLLFFEDRLRHQSMNTLCAVDDLGDD